VSLAVNLCINCSFFTFIGGLSGTGLLTATCELADRGPHIFAAILWVNMAQSKLVTVGNIFANPL